MSETRTTAAKIAKRYTREGTGYADRLYQLTYAIDEALRDERERCAKVADDHRDTQSRFEQVATTKRDRDLAAGKAATASSIADAIRGDTGHRDGLPETGTETVETYGGRETARQHIDRWTKPGHPNAGH